MSKKILVADPHPMVLQQLRHSPEGHLYRFEGAKEGNEALDKLQSLRPDLLIVDLRLPKRHGIEILKWARKEIDPKMGVIIISAHPMIQDYHEALAQGANDFLCKPLSIPHLFEAMADFFSGTLTPTSFHKPSEVEAIYPEKKGSEWTLKLWGTRGSTPVSGPAHLLFGGSTCCLEVEQGEERIIIDAGTAIHPLGRHLLSTPCKHFHLFIGHSHWDHIAGFPFFAPLYESDCKIEIWLPVGFGKSAQEVFFDMLTYPYFPIRLSDIKALLIFHDLRDGERFTFGSIQLETHYAFHPGSTLCFKITLGKTSIGYVTDNEFLMGHHGDPALIERGNPLFEPYRDFLSFFSGCHHMIHEAQYTPQEYRKKVGWGHSSLSNATLLMRECCARDWIITHHDPNHTDTDLEKKLQLHLDLIEELGIACSVRMAHDGLTLINTK